MNNSGYPTLLNHPFNFTLIIIPINFILHRGISWNPFQFLEDYIKFIICLIKNSISRIRKSFTQTRKLHPCKNIPTNKLTDRRHVNIPCNLFDHNIVRVHMTRCEITLSYNLCQPINVEDAIKSRFVINPMKSHDATITAVVMVQIQSLVVFFIIGPMIATRLPTSIGTMFLKILLE